MKKSQADIWFSKCIRAASNYTCQRCGKVYDSSSTGLHCSHNFSRRHRTIRWCKDNALSLCFSCHEWYGGNPADSGVWLENKIGSGALDILREKMNSRIKVPKHEETEIAKHYKKQFFLIEEKRIETTGYIEFVSWQ